MADAGGLAEDTARLKLDQGGTITATSCKGPRQPTVVGGKKLTNITDGFRQAAAALPAGFLVKDEDFTLFESVGALEIMDPKMDSGFLAPGETLFDEYDVLQKLLPEEIIGIMDQLVCYEMAWHQGYPLAQTLFTSHHIDNLLWPERRSLSDVQFKHKGLENTEDELLLILRAFCVGLIKCCDFVIQHVKSSHYFEEEDFSTHTYSRDLLRRYSTTDILAILDGARSALDGMMFPEPKLSQAIFEALASRLSMRRNLLLEFNLMDATHGESRKAALVALRQDLPTVQGNHELGQAVPLAFSPKLQRKLTSTTPPRPIVDMSFGEAIDHLKHLCDEAEYGARIHDTFGQGPEALRAFLFTFSARKPEPLPYSRSRVSGALLNRSDEWYIDLFRKDLELTIYPCCEILDPVNWTIDTPRGFDTPNPRHHIAANIDEFTGKVLPDFGGYLDYWKALGSNRCRFRRQLCHVALGFDELQRVGDDYDPSLESMVSDVNDVPVEALYQWGGQYKLRVIEWIIQLGFELEVYLPDELAGMYWLLSVVARRRSGVVESLLEFMLEWLGSHADNDARHEKTRKSIEFLKVQQTLAKGNEALAQALYTFYTCLHYLHLIPNTAAVQPHHDAALRYELRMKPFLTLQDGFRELFDDYHEALHLLGDFEDAPADLRKEVGRMCDHVDEFAKAARQAFTGLKRMGAEAASAAIVEAEWTAEVSACQKSSVATGLLVSRLRKIVKSSNQDDLSDIRQKFKAEVPGPRERYHDWWAVPTLDPNTRDGDAV